MTETVRLTPKANATRAMFNAILDETFDRAMKWFKDNPDEPYCYWAKDTFIKIADRDNPEILKKYPEIVDINDHTVVSVLGETVQLGLFCPNLREGIAELYKKGIITDGTERTSWTVSEDPANENYNMILRRK